MAEKEYVKTYINAAKTAISSPNGTAHLLSGFTTLKNGADAGVSASQMRAMFPDLRKYSDAKIEGFIEIGANIIEGETIIPSAIFKEPASKESVAE